MDFSQFKDKEIEEAFRQAFLETLEISRKTLPYKTGNLAYNALKWRRINFTDIAVYVDDSEAPYVEMLDKPSKSGKRKKSYGFWEVYSDAFFKTFKKIFKSKLKKR